MSLRSWYDDVVWFQEFRQWEASYKISWSDKMVWVKVKAFLTRQHWFIFKRFIFYFLFFLQDFTLLFMMPFNSEPSKNTAFFRRCNNVLDVVCLEVIDVFCSVSIFQFSLWLRGELGSRGSWFLIYTSIFSILLKIYSKEDILNLLTLLLIP